MRAIIGRLITTVSFLALIVLAACGGGGGSTAVTGGYTVGGTVSGLAGSVVLQDNSGDNLTVSVTGTFTFARPVGSGASYNVTVLTQPLGQSCTVTGGNGTATANVTNVTVSCATAGFSVSGNMITARQEHTATLLSNGKILVGGGMSGATTYASAELYDLASGVFAATGTMATARYGHTDTLLSNGKALIAGGFNGTTVASAELYDPATGIFSATGSMASARIYHTATPLLNGKVLVVGGSNAGVFTASAELYDPATGLFSATGSMTTPRRSHTATPLSGGRVLVTGGQNGASFLASAEIYDPATGLFTAANSMMTGRVSHTSTLLANGNVLVTGGFGGTSATTVYNVSAEVYDSATGIFSATGSMATARWLHTSTLLPNGTVLVAGGRNGGATAIALASVELYDPATGVFRATGNMATAREYHTATLLPGSKVLVTGGFSGGAAALASTELY